MNSLRRAPNAIYVGAASGALVATVSIAACSEHGEVDTQFIFGFTMGADVGELGEKEIESETVGRFGKGDGSYTALESQLRAEFTPTESLRFEIGVPVAHHGIDSVTPNSPSSLKKAPRMAQSDPGDQFQAGIKTGASCSYHTCNSIPGRWPDRVNYRRQMMSAATAAFPGSGRRLTPGTLPLKPCWSFSESRRMTMQDTETQAPAKSRRPLGTKASSSAPSRRYGQSTCGRSAPTPNRRPQTRLGDPRSPRASRGRRSSP